MRMFGMILTFTALSCLLPAVVAEEGPRCVDPACGGQGGCNDPSDTGSPTRCAHCGREVPCRPTVCDVVAETTKVKKHYWTVECQGICPLLPGCGSLRGGNSCEQCEEACENCRGVKGGPNCNTKCQVPPKPGHPRNVKKLVKKEYECEVPVYKGVVKYLCEDCRGKATPASAEVTTHSSTYVVAPLPAAPMPSLTARSVSQREDR